MSRDYQETGFVPGLSSKSLSEANRQINMCKNNTPEHLRDRYRSQIRSLRKDGGYAWYWVLK